VDAPPTTEAGYPLTVHGTSQQLKALLLHLSSQGGPPAAGVAPDVHAKQWLYTTSGKTEGPFSAVSLAKWHAKGYFPDRSFCVQHQASQMGLPLFIMLKMFPDAPAAARWVVVGRRPPSVAAAC